MPSGGCLTDHTLEFHIKKEFIFVYSVDFQLLVSLTFNPSLCPYRSTETDPDDCTYLQFKDIRGQLLQAVVREVHLLQLSPPEDGDRIWKTLDLIGGCFALLLRVRRKKNNLCYNVKTLNKCLCTLLQWI